MISWVFREYLLALSLCLKYFRSKATHSHIVIAVEVWFLLLSLYQLTDFLCLYLLGKGPSTTHTTNSRQLLKEAQLIKMCTCLCSKPIGTVLVFN